MCRTDREYVECCLDGHPDVFRQLVVRYQGVLLSYLTGRLGDRDRAEEAAQETLVRAYFGLSKLKQAETFCSWLLGIATRVASQQQRVDHRRREVARAWAERGPDPELSHDYGLERAVAGLPEPYRQVTLLRYYGGLSCAQVAEELEVPLGTVTKQLSRAYGLLRETLRQSQDADEDREVLR
jgi:RNA polymerase sigma-70 factor (ECF subfamily)